MWSIHLDDISENRLHIVPKNKANIENKYISVQFKQYFFLLICLTVCHV